MQFPAFLTDNRPYLIADGEVALQWASTIEERRKPLRGVRLLTRQDRAISTETSFNVPSATTTTTNIGLPFCSSNPALTTLPTPYSSAIAIASDRSIPDILKLASSAFSFRSRLATGVTRKGIASCGDCFSASIWSTSYILFFMSGGNVGSTKPAYARCVNMPPRGTVGTWRRVGG
jgi:hypothetical protein